jgi:hypothetical protein
MALIIPHQFSMIIMAIAPLTYSVRRPYLSLLFWCECMLLSILFNGFFVVVNLSLDFQVASRFEIVLQLA